MTFPEEIEPESGDPHSERKYKEQEEPLRKAFEYENGESAAPVDKNKNNTWQRLKHDRNYRNKFITTVYLWWSFIALGWSAGQNGPSFLDFQLITKTTFDKAAAFMTGGAVGYLTGSVIAGFLSLRVNGQLLLTLTCLGFGLLTIVKPWCSVYEVMILLNVCCGITAALQDSVGNAELLRIWGSENESYMQALHFFFAFGGILSPLATAPFLAQKLDSNSTSLKRERINLTSDIYIQISTTTQSPSFSFNTGNHTKDLKPNNVMFISFENASTTDNDSRMTNEFGESRIYIAFLITGILYISSSFLFIITYIRQKKQKKKKENKPEVKGVNHNRKLPLIMKIIVCITISVLMGTYCAIEESFSSFLTAFVVKQLGWTKQTGAYATSIFWALFCAGRFLGIFFIHIARPFLMILGSFTLLHLVFIGMIISTIREFSPGIFICSAVAGLAMSVVFPTLFSFTEEKLLPVSGKVVSLLMFSAAVGGMVNPLVMGYFMENVSPLFFCYLPLGECVCFSLSFFVAVCLSRKIRKYISQQNCDQINAR